MTERPVLIVDAANIVGSVPDGWWRDRVGATARLAESLSGLATRGFEAARLLAPVDITLVVEGQARAVTSTSSVVVVAARGSGDDTIVDLVRDLAPVRRCVVATADRELRRRVESEGGETVGPRTLLRELSNR